jgi:hypothetical protein
MIGGRDGRVVEQPRERDVGWLLTHLLAQRLVLLELCAMLLNHFELDGTRAEVVEALLRREAKEWRDAATLCAVAMSHPAKLLLPT